MRSCLAILLCVCAAPVTVARAAAPEAARAVKTGLERFAAGDYAAAEKAFGEAQKKQPDDKRIAFDRACAYAAQGKRPEALVQFRKAALADDAKLAGRSHFNMGCLAIGETRTLLGETPESAPPEARQSGIDEMETAVAHFRDACRLDTTDADARHNLEAARLWIHHIQEVWRQADLQQQREKSDAIVYLKMLDRRQRELRTKCKSLSAEPPSPRRRQDVFETERDQRRLAEEIEPLTAKILASMQAPSPEAADAEKMVQWLAGMAEATGGAMRTAAGCLRDNRATQSVRSQTESVEKLDQVYMLVAPYLELVQTAIARQTELIAQSKRAAGEAADDEADAEPVDLHESAWNQQFVARWAQMIAIKAQMGLEAMPPKKTDAEADAAADPPVTGPAAPDPQEAARKQQEALREAMQRAVELAPQVVELTSDAVVDLEDKRPAAAMPKQEEALELLEKMLPEQEQEEKEDEDQQDRQDQEKKDQKKKDEEKKDEKKKDQQQEKEDERQQEKQRAQPRDLSRQQADAVLRKARERQREREELEKLLRLYLYRPDKVEKDW